VTTVDFLSNMDDPSKGVHKFPDDDA